VLRDRLTGQVEAVPGRDEVAGGVQQNIVVRWLWRDLYRRGVIRDRVLRAFARSS
jgi:hypothetical protein